MGSFLITFVSGFPVNTHSAIKINDHMMVKIHGIKWVTIPWKDVQWPVPYLRSWRGGTFGVWVVPVRHRLTRWHSHFGGMVLGRWQPAVWIDSSLPQYEKLLQRIEHHILEQEEAHNAEEE